MIPWLGQLKFRTCNLGKIEYAALVRMVCYAVWGYMCKMKIHTAEAQNLEDTVLSLSDRNLGQNHHICHAILIIE